MTRIKQILYYLPRLIFCGARIFQAKKHLFKWLAFGAIASILGISGPGLVFAEGSVPGILWQDNSAGSCGQMAAPSASPDTVFSEWISIYEACYDNASFHVEMTPSGQCVDVSTDGRGGG
jgi:hypothetical protein